MGNYILIYSMVMLTTTCALSGLPLTVLREMRLSQADRNSGVSLPIVNLAVAVLLSMCLVISAVILIIFGLAGAAFYDGLLERYILLSVVWFWSASMNWLLGEIFRGYNDFRWASLYEGQFGGLGATVALIAILIPVTLFSKINLTQAIWLQVIVSASMAVIGVVRLRLIQPIHLEFGSKAFCWSAWKLFSSSLPVAITNLTTNSMSYIEVLIAGIWIPSDQVAIYGIANQLTRVVSQPLRLVNQSVLPFVTDLHMAGDKVGMQKLLRGAATLATVLSIPLLVALLVFPGSILAFCYGEHFRDGGWVLQIVAACTFVSVCVGGTGLTLVMTGNQYAVMKLSLVLTAIYLCIAPFGFKAFGQIGVVGLSSGLVITRSIATLLLVYYKLGILTLADFRKDTLLHPLKLIRGMRNSRKFAKV